MTENFGQILALVGLVLVLLNNMGRQRSRKRPPQPQAAPSLWQRVGPLAAYGFILAGLVWMLAPRFWPLK